MERYVDVAIIGAGSAGLYALSIVRRKTDNFVIINGGPYGTTCARVGCMPSKVLIQVAEDFHRRKKFPEMGIHHGENLQVDIPQVMRHVRQLRDTFVGRVMERGINRLGEKKIDGYAEFVEPTVLKVENQYIHAKKVIIATGTRPFIPKEWEAYKDYLITTDTLFEQETLPGTMGVLGLGVIGLEIGQALSHLGIQVTGADMLEFIGGIKDPHINQTAVAVFEQEMDLWLGEAAELSQQDGKLKITCGPHQTTVDKALASLGRVPNVESLGLDKLGIKIDERGIPEYDPHTMQIADLPIFIAGDVDGERPVLHEAGEEGRIAGHNAVNSSIQRFKRKTPLSITFTNPNIASIGENWQAILKYPDVIIGRAQFETQGRAMIMGKNRGMLQVYASKNDGRLLGAELIMPHGEHIAHLLSWAIQQNLTIQSLIKMPFYHPVIEEGLQGALNELAMQLKLSTEEVWELTPLAE